MIILFILLIYCELNEKGYLYSVGKQQFLSIKDKKVNLAPKGKFPSQFEIETRTEGSSYTLRIYPVPREDDNVLDKDWWYNDHKLIFYPKNEWQSQHFVFAMLPKNMLKIVVKERCAEVKDDGSIKASLCKSRSQNKNQYFKWISERDKYLVEAFVRKHKEGYDDDFMFDNPQGKRYPSYENGDFGRPGRGQNFPGGGMGKRPHRDNFDPRDCDDEEEDFFERIARRRGQNGGGGSFNNSRYPGGRGPYGGGYRGDNGGGGPIRGMDSCDNEEFCDPENGYMIDRPGSFRNRGKNMGLGYGRGNSNTVPINNMSCGGIIDEIDKIICEFNKIPSFF